jgi:predicted outer membrane repeat protein
MECLPIGINTNGTVWAWGVNGNGNLGDGTQISRNIPVQVKDADNEGYLNLFTGCNETLVCPDSTCNVAKDGSNETGNGSEAKPFATIQHGIDVAKDDYTVLVHPGTYVENINFNGKNIIVKSTDGAEKTVIDGNQNGTVVTAKSEETAKAVLEGFTITKGSASGIYLGKFSTPTLKNLIVENNQANSGGGIVITSNTVWNRGSQLTTLENVVIRNNTATKSGGGLHNYLAAFNYKGGEISGNKAPEGAGAYLIYGSGYYGGRNKFTNVTFKDNVATGNGGGLYVYSTHNPDHLYVDLSNIAITGNTAKEGSGIYCNGDANGHTYVKGFDENVVTDNTGAEWQVYSNNKSKCHGLTDIPGGSQVKLVAVIDPSPVCKGEDFDVTFRMTITEPKTVNASQVYLNFDPTVLKANSLVTNTSAFDFPLEEDYSNADGYIHFSAMSLSNDPLTGTADLFTVNFTVLAESDNTLLQFDSSSTYSTSGEEQLTQTSENLPLKTGCALEYQVELQGRPAKPHDNWKTDLAIWLGDGQTAVKYDSTTDNNGQGILANTLPADEEYFCVKNIHTLANKVMQPFPMIDDKVDFGTLLEGDVNNDNKVSIMDSGLFSQLFKAFMLSSQYDARADFNADNAIDINDAFYLTSLKKGGNNSRPTADDLANNLICQGPAATEPKYRSGTRDGKSVSLSTTPIPTGIEVGSTFDVDIKVNLQGTTTNAAAAHLNYNPEFLQVNQLTAGNMFDFVLENDFDNEQGQINFAAMALDNPLPEESFILVTVNLTLLQADGEKTLTFNITAPRQTEAVFGGKSVISEQRGEVVIIAPASCQLYAVHDEKRNDSQFFTMRFDDLTISALGPLYKGHDIESLAIHPETNMIYAASGDNVTNGKPGHFYLVDGENGDIYPVGSTLFDEIEDLTFSPDGILYAWAKGDGLITIDDLTTGEGTLVLPYSKPLIEGLTLKKNEGNVFFGAVGTDLWQYDLVAKTLEVICPDKLLGETEALEIMPDGLLKPDGLLLIGTHNVPFGLHAFNPETCEVIEADETLSNQYNDVEGIAVPVEACGK